MSTYRQTLQVTIGSYSGQKFDGRPESRGYELHLFGCWPGELCGNVYLKCLKLSVLIFFKYFFLAEHVMVNGDTEVPYMPMVRLSPTDSNKDYWTYDGRYCYVFIYVITMLEYLVIVMLEYLVIVMLEFGDPYIRIFGNCFVRVFGEPVRLPNLN